MNCVFVSPKSVITKTIETPTEVRLYGEFGEQVASFRPETDGDLVYGIMFNKKKFSLSKLKAFVDTCCEELNKARGEV